MSTVALPRPAERVAIVSLCLVFLCGVALGAVAMSYWARPTFSHSIPASKYPISVTEWKRQLNLTEDQTRQLTSTLDDFELYYDNVLTDLNSRVLMILNADQKRKYREMIDRHKK